MSKEVCLHIFERYISGEASQNEVTQLKSFLENDADLSRWLEIQIMNSDYAIDPDIKMQMLSNIRSQVNYNTSDVSPKNFRHYLRWAPSVAAVLIVLIFSLYLYLKPQKIELFEITASHGEKAILTLPEGSKVVINSNSKISYNNDYNEDNRFLKLEGEAFFEVKYNQDKPFIVECKDITVKVLGTSFDIKDHQIENNISIVLNSGQIELTTPKETIKMSPNDRIIYNRITQTTTLEKVNAKDYTDWSQNRLRFENESLEVIMKTISQIYNVNIIFEDLQLKNQRFTGPVDNTSINSVLDAIKLTSSINYRIKDGAIYLYEIK